MDLQGGQEATWLDLYDWRARVASMYREREEALREGKAEQVVVERFRARKDELFAQHPQTPISPGERAAFTGLRYFPYDPDFRVVASLEPGDSLGETRAETSGTHPMPLRRAAIARFSIGSTQLQLTVYWIDVYGGGLFLPFRDATCPGESYGGGRYLFDTVKGSDFLRLDSEAAKYGYAGGDIVLDFNYAYNPSCAYDPRWVCPLAPRENTLAVAVRAGERKFHE